MADSAIPSLNGARDRDLLTEFALWISPVWERGNSDDEESARAAVDAFLREVKKAERGR